MEVLPCVSKLWWQCWSLLCKKITKHSSGQRTGENNFCSLIRSLVELGNRNSPAWLNVCLFIQDKKVLKGEVIVTSLQKALWEQGEPLSWEVRRTSLCPCLGAAPGTGPWALPLWCCLYPAPQGAASVSPSHLTSYLGQDSFFPKYFLFKMPGNERKGLLSLKFLKMGEKDAMKKESWCCLC